MRKRAGKREDREQEDKEKEDGEQQNRQDENKRNRVSTFYECSNTDTIMN